jgi:hypothetical protein
MQKIKTIDIQAREWFDRANGNSYFSAQITTNFGMEDQKTYYLPFQYGYGDHYTYAAKQHLVELGVIDADDRTGLWAWCKDNGVIYRYSKQEGCKQADCKAWGHNPDHIYCVSYLQDGYKRRKKSGELFNLEAAQAYAEKINLREYAGMFDAKVKLA